jgi:hypothetical protein
LPSGWEWGNGRSSTGWHKHMVPMRELANRDPRALDWSTRYLRQRWEAGERNGTVLWEELKAKGYTIPSPQCLSASGQMAGTSTLAWIACFA